MSQSPRRQNEIDTREEAAIDDIFSYMCSLAVAKCSKRSEKKKASCGGAAMRKRLLIKNFVTQLLDQERQISPKGREQLSREVSIPGRRHFHNNSLLQTRIREDDEAEMDDDDEVDEGVDEEYSPVEDNQQMSEDEELTEEDRLSDDEDPEDSMNNNQKSVKQLPAISTLDLDLQHQRPFGPNPYVGAENALSICDDDAADLNDELELFGSKSGMTASATAGNGVMKQAPPSWHEPEPDLFMLERSTPSSLYYDDYASVQTIASSTETYRMTYHRDDSSVLQSTTYQMSAHQTSNQFMISEVSSSTGTYGEDHSARHLPPQLPENFMDDAIVSSASTTLLTSTNTTTNSYAELCTNKAKAVTVKSLAESTFHDYVSTELDDVDDSTGVTSIDLCAEEKAQEVDGNEEEDEDTETSDEDDEPQSIVSSAFVDLINMVPSPIKRRPVGDCRVEAMQDACFNQSRHITDLDTQLTLIEDDEFAEDHSMNGPRLMMADTKLYDPLLLHAQASLADLIGTDGNGHQPSGMPVSGSPSSLSQGTRSPRKRLPDYGLVLTSLSPKRIKL